MLALLPVDGLPEIRATICPFFWPIGRERMQTHAC